MRFFFYGTLRDRDLLSLVLGRPVARHALKPALLRDWRRHPARGKTYPILLRERGAATEGDVLDGVSTAEQRRLTIYEGEGYDLIRVFATIGSGDTPLGMMMFAPSGKAPPALDGDWSLDDWRIKHKARALEAVRENVEKLGF
ncbi:MAG: gamma-glutamylcyclotransferase [Alphaproteobacteria bacterium]|nr:gamma-glutamylcyclotransferase [Alphaproteobacteria bacterium]